MKKILTFVLALVTVLGIGVFATSCGGPQTEFKPDGEVKGTLRLGFDAEFPPYGYLDAETDEYAGFDIELAKTVCNKIGYTLVLVPINWDYKDTLLDSGEIDCIWNGFTMTGREAQYTWSPAYSNSSIIVLTKDNAGINAVADLAGKAVTVQAGSSGELALCTLDENDEILLDASGNKTPSELAATFKGGTFQTDNDYTEAFTKLETGAVDAIVVDIGTAQNLIAGKTGYKILADVITAEEYAIGFKLGNTELCNTVWNAVTSIPKADIAALAAKYEIADSITIDD